MKLLRVGAEEAAALAHDVWQVYDAVFGDWADEASWRRDVFDRHVARPDFRLILARSEAGVAGFAYGYTGNRGEYWPDRVVEALGPEVAHAWIGGHFELVELAVLPGHRGKGLGSRLHDDLMGDLPHDRALLSTDEDEGPAVRLYRSRGWERVGLLAPGVQVMGRRLRPSSDVGGTGGL